MDQTCSFFPLKVWCKFFKKCWVQVGRIFEFAKLILSLKTFLEDGLPPSGQTIGSLLIPPVWQTSREIDLSIAPMDSTNLKIRPIQTLLKINRFFRDEKETFFSVKEEEMHIQNDIRRHRKSFFWWTPSHNSYFVEKLWRLSLSISFSSLLSSQLFLP